MSQFTWIHFVCDPIQQATGKVLALPLARGCDCAILQFDSVVRLMLKILAIATSLVALTESTPIAKRKMDDKQK